MSNKTHARNNIINQNELQATTMLPQNKISTFSQNFNLFTSFNSGKLVPLMSKEIYPGDILELDIAALIKQVSPVFPTMGNAKISVWNFFVPNRLIWNDFKTFMGETANAWYQESNKVVPHIAGTTTFKYTVNDLASYLGLPSDIEVFKTGNTYNRLKFNAYCKIWNDWFRDQNLQNEVMFNANSEDINISNSSNTYNTSSFLTNLQYGRELAPVSKLPDYFTTCLPSPQRGPSVNILSAINKVPVVYGEETDPSALMTDLANSGVVFDINDLRFSIALQHFRELNARAGTRYIEQVLAHFGVKSKDLRTQRAQFLGGFTRDLVMSQVTQMVETAQSTNVNQGLGAFGGFSNTLIRNEEVEKVLFPAEEHGYFFTLAAVRVEQIYGQGIDKEWNKRVLEDFYFPTFANIGEQPVYSSEIYFDPNKKNETEIFGYNEAWSYLRWEQNKLSGYFSPNSTINFLSMTYANKFANQPMLNNDFIQEDKSRVSQTLRVQDKHQYYGQIAFKIKLSRELPVQSIPGLKKI